jgi:hypothetical protein
MMGGNNDFAYEGTERWRSSLATAAFLRNVGILGIAASMTWRLSEVLAKPARSNKSPERTRER